MREPRRIGGFAAGILAILAGTSGLRAQEPSRLTPEQREEIVRAVCDRLEKIYPDAKIGRETSLALSRALEGGRYADSATGPELAKIVTDDLERASRDLHLDLLYNPGLAKALRGAAPGAPSAAAGTAAEADAERWTNYGFRELRILGGNVGYLDLRVFFAPEYAGDTAAAAMGFFAGCRALIIDLRQNGGGWDGMVNLLLGYFIDPRDEGVFTILRSTLTEDSYAVSVLPPYVPGRRLTGIPVYVLTSGSTASGAEAFAYRMKHFKRATLVGVRTAGAERPVEHIALDDEFVFQIPAWKTVFSATGAGWEGRGVEPDIAVDAGQALDTAYRHALETLLDKAADEKDRGRVRWALDGLKAKIEPPAIDRRLLESCAGRYGTATISFENGALYFQGAANRPRRRLVPITQDYFALEGRDDRRLRIVREGDKITALQVIDFDGSLSSVKREPAGL